jgi:nitrogen fixation protein NifB
MQAAQEVVMQNHPCFNEDAHERVGRVHLPVAPKCNIQCNFCERRVCMNLAIQHPGWTAKVLSAAEALDMVRSIIRSKGKNFVVGVAGPGDSLANEATFEALKMIHHEYPTITKCLSTNGLLLADKFPQILEAGITALTVTVNTVDIDVGQQIYNWVRHDGQMYHGKEAVRLLITKQFQGIKKAVEAGLLVKVNTVLIPGVNDNHIMILASRLRDAGIKLMNIMPLIPSGKMKKRHAPTCEEMSHARQECEAFVPQFCRCQHCRADAVYFPNSYV